jgi:hypothetical protein
VLFTANLFQKDVRGSPSQGCSEETFGKIGTEQLDYFALRRICTSVFGGQKEPCQAQFDGFRASAIFSGLLVYRPTFSVSAIEKCSERITIRHRRDNYSKEH